MNAISYKEIIHLGDLHFHLVVVQAIEESVVEGMVANLRTPPTKHVDLLLDQLMLTPKDRQGVKGALDRKIRMGLGKFTPDTDRAFGIDGAILPNSELVRMGVVKSHDHWRRSGSELHSVADIFGNRHRTKAHFIQVFEVLFELRRRAKHRVRPFSEVVIHDDEDFAIEIWFSIGNTLENRLDAIKYRRGLVFLLSNDRTNNKIYQFT